MSAYQPIRLLCIVKPFDDPDFVWEWRSTASGGLAFLENGRCRLVSRNGHTFTQWDALTREIAMSVRCRSAVLDGEIACLEEDGRSNFTR